MNIKFIIAKKKGDILDSNNEGIENRGEPNDSPVPDNILTNVLNLAKRGCLLLAFQSMVKCRWQYFYLFPVIHSSEDKSNNNIDSQMSEYFNGGNLDKTWLLKTSHFDGSVYCGFSNLRSKHYSKPSSINSAESLL